MTCAQGPARRARTGSPIRLACALALVLASTATAPQRALPDPTPEGGMPVAKTHRGLWVWKTATLAEPAARDRFFAFVADRHFDTLFLSTQTRHLREDPGLFAQCLATAHRQGLAVHALNGSADWLEESSRVSAARFLQTVFEYNAAAAPDARFDAIHLDVEPNALPAWKQGRREALAARYVDLLKACGPQVHGQRLVLAVDIPTSFAELALDAVPFLDVVLQCVDQCAVMAYKHDAGKVLRAAEPVVAAADRLGKQVWVGVSAKREHLPAEGPAAALEQILGETEAALRPHASFLGVAVHDYARYEELRAR